MSLSTKRVLTALVGLLVTVAALVHSQSANACSCTAKPPAREEFARSKLVFEAKAVSTESLPPRLKTTLHVLRWWKGASSSDIVVVDQDTLCGFAFERGKTYLVYASEDAGAVSVSFCSRTTTSDITAERKTVESLASAAPVASSLPSSPTGLSAAPASDAARAPAPSASTSATVAPVPPPAKSGCSASGVERRGGVLTLGLFAALGAALRARRTRRPRQ